MGTCVRNWLNTGKIQENLFLKRLFSPTSCYLLQNFPACKPTTKNMRPPSYIGCLFPGSQGYFLYASSTKKQHLIISLSLEVQAAYADNKQNDHCNLLRFVGDRFRNHWFSPARISSWIFSLDSLLCKGVQGTLQPFQ